MAKDELLLGWNGNKALCVKIKEVLKKFIFFCEDSEHFYN